MQRESMTYDVVIVGAGPAGLACGCRLKQLNPQLDVCLVEKGSEVGAHILSGAIIETTALDELLPQWKNDGAPLHTPVSDDQLWRLADATRSTHIPSWLAPFTLHNTSDNYIVSLGNLCRWLAEQAEGLGVEIFPGFAAAELICEDDTIKGIIIGDMGRDREGAEKENFTPGMELRAHYTVLAEGCRGHLGKKAIAKFALDWQAQPPHYGLGIKELWKIPAAAHRPGQVIHTVGWPLDESHSLGGGFLYHLDNQQVSVGLITDLNYRNPHVSPFDEFQRYKHHPAIAQHLKGGERLAYGARAINKGSIQSQPRMHFPGGLIIGDDAGTLNNAKIKGTHTAMKSGMIGAETIAGALANGTQLADLTEYASAFKRSWAYQELHLQRNFAPAQHRWGNIIGSAYAFIDINIFRGKLPWTLKDMTSDHLGLHAADQSAPINYPKPDGQLSFDKLSSVYLSNTHHEDNQPCHLQLQDPTIATGIHLSEYDEPAQRYCPAGVYEIIDDAQGHKALQINAQNCLHCKTCDIKDPSQNITWVTPEGGGGPNYPNM